MRAYLIARPGVPALLSAALAIGADALVLERGGSGSWADLAELVETARAQAPALRLCPRITAINELDAEAALVAIMPAAPDAIVLPVEHGRDVTHLGALLAVHEAEAGLADGSTQIVALVDSARAVLTLPSLVGASPRLLAIGWDAVRLARELRALRAMDEAGWIGPLAQLRGSVRLTAAAAGVDALDASLPADDPDGFARALAAARRDGFAGMIAHALKQVVPIRHA